MAAAGGVSRWTRWFTTMSALSMVALQGVLLLGLSIRTVAIVGIFGVVLPMVFGMAYLLLPSYAGRTLSARWLPGVHFAVAYAGAGILLGDEIVGLDASLVALGGSLWSLGVAIFVGTLLWTVVPAIVARPEIIVRSDDRPQRSTRFATLLIPVALGYLVVGTIALLSMTTSLPNIVGETFSSVVHYYAAGFAALLIFTLGARLMTGFFHISPPRYATWIVLLSGAIAPGILALHFWRSPWFLVGGGLELVAMAGYVGLVGIVAYRTDRRRIGLYGITFGALSGIVAVGAAVLLAAGSGEAFLVDAHVAVILDGFFLLTIIGYAYQFFPVTNGQFPGATKRTALATILLVAIGVFLHTIGAFVGYLPLRTAGLVSVLLGTVGYSYLLIRRFHG